MKENENYRMLGWLLLIVVFILIAVSIIASSATKQGYKQGQLDYATGKIEYTIQDGRTIQYLDGKE